MQNYLNQDTQNQMLNSTTSAADRRKVYAAILKNNCVIRYRSLNHRQKVISAIRKGRLYFSTALGYNDLYDTLMYIDYDVLLGYIDGCIAKCMPSYLNEKVQKKEITKELATRLLTCSRMKRNEFLKYIKENIDSLKKDLRDNIKGICFSADLLSSLMWSHYADNHKGIALLYDKKELTTAIACNSSNKELEDTFQLCEVKYKEQRIDATQFVSDYYLRLHAEHMGLLKAPFGIPASYPTPDMEIAKEIILTKSTAWSYEKEYRLIPSNLNFEKPNDIKYLEIFPKAIVMGAQISSKNQKLIWSLADKQQIPLYEIWLNESQQDYNLVFQQVNNVNVVEPLTCID